MPLLSVLFSLPLFASDGIMAKNRACQLKFLIVVKPSFEKKLIIAVIGGGKCSAQEAVLAEAVGRELARRGAVLVCGGLTGVMEAACRGASIEAGLPIGILPSDNPA